MKLYHEIPNLTHTAVALGCFDGVHLGHQAVIQAAQGESCERTVFTFADGRTVKSGAPRLMTFEEKCRLLERQGTVHLIAPPFEAVRTYEPQRFFHEVLRGTLGAEVIACGENYRFGKNAAGTADTMRHLCERDGIICHIVPPVMVDGRVISSSRIRQALADGCVEQAGDMLGRRFSYEFEVVHGRERGRTLGTPTINQFFPEGFLMPRRGVYASMTEWEGRIYGSVTNIGVKPTVGSPVPLSETWIAGFSGDLYGQRVRVSLISFLREERRFASLEELKQAILHDEAAARRLAAPYIAEGGARDDIGT